MFDNFEQRIIEKAKTVITELVRDVADLIEDNTPEDTYELISRNQIVLPHIEGDSIKAKVFNDDPKAKFVEYGQEPKVYSYYKKSGRRKGGAPFYTGSGARMFKRAIETIRPTIHDRLLSITKK